MTGGTQDAAAAWREYEALRGVMQAYFNWQSDLNMVIDRGTATPEKVRAINDKYRNHIRDTEEQIRLRLLDLAIAESSRHPAPEVNRR